MTEAADKGRPAAPGETTPGRANSDAYTEAVLKASPDAIITMDHAGRLVEFNPAAERIFGYARAEAIGRQLAELIIPERLRDAHHRGLAHYLTTGEGPVLHLMNELPALRADGTEFPVEITIVPIADSRMFTAFVRDISARKRTEELAERLAAIVSSSADAIVGKNLDGVITSWNRGAERLFGYTADEAVGASILMLFPPERRDEEQTIVDRIRKGETIDHYEAPRLRKDGSEVWVSLTVSPLRNGAGEIVGASKIARDITARKQVEEALRESEARQAFVLSLGDHLRDLHDPRGVMAAAAEALGRHLGVSRVGYGEIEPDGKHIRYETCWTDGAVAPIVGVYPLGVFGAALMADLARGLTTTYADTQADPRFARLGFAAVQARAAMAVPLVREGKLRATLYLSDSAPRPWPAHEVTLVEDVAARIWAAVEQARAEEALRESEDRFRAIAENVPQLAWMADGEGNVDWFNKGWLDYTGTVLEDNVGVGWKAVHHPDHVEAVAEKFERHLREKRDDWEDTFPLRGADGEYRWFLSRMNAIRDDAGNVVRFFGTNTDITETRKAEERLRFLTNELAHRGKNLLAVVQAIVSRSLSGKRSLAEARAVIEQRIQALARSQSTLVSDGIEGMPLAETIRAEIEAFSGQVEVVGPEVILNARAAQTAALLVHELATNATKHGALSQPGGRVTIHWRIEGKGAATRFRFRWQERGGPPVTTPTRRGFGSVVLEQAVTQDFGAAPTIAYAPEGLSYDLDAPLSAIVASFGAN